MSVRQNIFVAKKYLVDIIWKSANLEGIAVTFPQTEGMYDNRGVGGLLESEDFYEDWK